MRSDRCWSPNDGALWLAVEGHIAVISLTSVSSLYELVNHIFVSDRNTPKLSQDFKTDPQRTSYTSYNYVIPFRNC